LATGAITEWPIRGSRSSGLRSSTYSRKHADVRMCDWSSIGTSRRDQSQRCGVSAARTEAPDGCGAAKEPYITAGRMKTTGKAIVAATAMGVLMLEGPARGGAGALELARQPDILCSRPV
jgi:hypothetical protein